MSKFNIMDVDLKLLTIFNAVYEEGSISKGAKRLSLSQPVVSHSLDRLRLAFNDPLFVRAGRTIVPTERAKNLATDICELIDKLLGLAVPEVIDLAEIDTLFCLSANDFERQFFAPYILGRMLNEAPNAKLRLVSTKDNFIEDLRTRECDIVLSPLTPPGHLDIYSVPLFEDHSMFFFDPSEITASEVLSNYLNLEHAVVRFGIPETQISDRIYQELGIDRKVKLEVPSFEALPAMMRGTSLVATLPSSLKNSLFSDFGSVPLPFDFPKVKFNMIWHKTTHSSPVHQWFRALISSVITASSDKA
ncbi:LysR family transcriptional regulator [Aliamphritea spongicola]|uniref:LysR family transcriptional regulator n=1 Tax=Aliamphritea spongicola TaxID=707589 RepID=UPI00196A606D|nr:LysR family transcriptional regulator [Aliamphritea spongicola]MBN3563264.1 LysR family transcriptional regulator [Aliamphritea spongicola]